MFTEIILYDLNCINRNYIMNYSNLISLLELFLTKCYVSQNVSKLMQNEKNMLTNWMQMKRQNCIFELPRQAKG